MTLIFTKTKGLHTVEELPETVLVGEYVRHAWKGWRLRVKRKTSGRSWKNVGVDQLPTRLKVEALLLGIQL